MWAEPGANGEYLESTVSFRTGEEQHFADFMILSRASHDIYIDDLTMSAQDGVNLLQNGDFEEELSIYSCNTTRYAIDTSHISVSVSYTHLRNMSYLLPIQRRWKTMTKRRRS